MTGSDVIRRLRSGERIDRPFFAPVLTGLAARAGCVTVDDMYADAAVWTSSLVAAAALFGVDGVVAGYRPDLLLEAHAATDPAEAPALQIAVDTMRRVFYACTQDRLGIGAMPGPLTFAARLEAAGAGSPECGELKASVVTAVECICDTRPDLLLLVEDGPLPGGPSPAYRRLYQTVRNVASYYDIPVGLYVEGYEVGSLEAYLALGCDVWLAGPSAEGGYGEAVVFAQAAEVPLAVGVGLAVGDAAAAESLVQLGLELREAAKSPGVFFTVNEPGTARRAENLGPQAVPAATPKDLHALKAHIDRAGGRPAGKGGTS